MQPRNIAFLNAWNRTPLMTRLAILAGSVIEGERAQMGVSKLIALVAVMASHLSSEARVAVADQLRAEADLLVPPFDRHALH
jgi:hypothetical protein